MPRKLRRPIALAPWIKKERTVEDPEALQKFLRFMRAELHAQTGDDDDPSEVWNAIAEMTGVNANDHEIGQDLLLLPQDLITNFLDAMGADGVIDKAKLAAGLAISLGAFGPEMYADVIAAQND